MAVLRVTKDAVSAGLHRGHVAGRNPVGLLEGVSLPSPKAHFT